MRSLVPLSTRVARRGLSALAVTLLVLTTGCDFITGRPGVKRVGITLVPDTIQVGQTSIATGTPYDDDDKPITSSRVKVGFSSSNPAIATVNASSGQVVGVAIGTTTIIASSQSKTASATVVVIPPRVVQVRVNPNPINLIVGQTLKLDIAALDPSGNRLSGRAVTAVPSNTQLLTVVGNGTVDNMSLLGVAPGVTNLRVTSENATTDVTVTVMLTPPARVTVGLQKGGSTVLVNETTTITPQLFDAGGQALSTIGRNIACTSNDQTVATVTGFVLRGVNPGRATLTCTTENNVQGQLAITVQQVPVVNFLFRNPNPVFRKGATRLADAVALDSANNDLHRTISYTSSNPNVIQISSTGLATPRDTGTATLVAAVDNFRDTLRVRVTLLPIAQVTVSPNVVERMQGETVQFSATVVDSLNGFVTDRRVTWLTGSRQIATINETTGLATAVGPGATGVVAQIERVPGEGNTVASAAASLTVRPTPIDTISVSQTEVAVKVGQATAISLIPRDAAGNQLFGREGSIRVTVENAAIAGADANGTINGRAPGTTTITYQAIDASLLPQGKPSRITVTVSPATSIKAPLTSKAPATSKAPTTPRPK